MTSDGLDLDYDRDVVGVEVEVGAVQITREQIARYCEAVGETNPLYLDEEAAAAGPYGAIIAPPSILGALEVEHGLDPKVRFGNAMFAAGTLFEIYEPIRVGDTIRVRTQVKEIYPKTGRSGTMVFAVQRSTYRNQHGMDVAMQEFSSVFREV